METFTPEQEAELEKAYALQRSAYAHEQRGELDTSFNLRRQALTLEEAVVGPESDCLAVSLDSLAIDLYNDKQYEEAEALFRRTLAIYKTVSGPESLDVAHSLRWLAFVYDDRKQYAKALQLLSWSIRLSRKNLGPNYGQKAQVLTTYANLLKATGRKVRSEAMRKRAASFVFN